MARLFPREYFNQFETADMPSLKLNFRNKLMADFPLEKGHSLTIGRKKNNDVIIDNLAVSSHHAKIDSVGVSFVLIDLQSKNGSFVNEKQVNSHWLKPGDIINIGKHSLVFGYSENEALPENETDEIDKTMIMDTSQYRSMVSKSNEKAAPPPVDAKKRDSIGIIKFLKGGEGKFKCRSKILKIGKHRDSDVVVKGFWVGHTSATISKGPDGFCLTYVGGMSRPKVNGEEVKREIILTDADVIKVGAAELQFFERKPRKPGDRITEKATQADPQPSPE